MNTKILFAAGVLIILIGGIFVFSQKSEMEPGEGMRESEVNREDSTMSPQANEQGTGTESDEMMTGGYRDYDAKYLDFAESGKVVLFFKADWCPTCKALDADIQNNLASIPEDILILKVNYDTAKDLKKKYGVLRQHTLVSVDKDGNMLSTWQGSSTLAEVLRER